MQRVVAESYVHRLRSKKGGDFWRLILGDVMPREHYEHLVVEARLVSSAAEAERCLGMAMAQCDPRTMMPLRRAEWQPPDEGNAYWHFAGFPTRLLDTMKKDLDRFC